MSKHAEFEATLRDLPQISLEKLKSLKQKTLQNIKKYNETKPAADPPRRLTQNEIFDIKVAVDSDNDEYINEDKFNIAGALCAIDPTLGGNCKDKAEHAFNNLCLAESITNGKEPRFVCDDDWVSTIGADSDNVKKFTNGYDLWKKTFLKSVKWLLQSQAAIKLKRNVSVPLGYRQASLEGDFLDTVYFEENAWNKAFSKLQPSTKISEQSLWLLAFLFHTDRVQPYPADDGLQEICTFVGRSMEVRTDNALSSLKILAYNPDLIKSITIDDFDDFQNRDLILQSMKYGNPQYISRLLDKKQDLPVYNEIFENGIYLAMQEDNQALFDFVLMRTIVSGKTAIIKDLLVTVALNSIKYKNNDSYFLKLLAARNEPFPAVIQEAAKLDDYSSLLQTFERRLVLRNPFINTLSLGAEESRDEFLKKVKRFYSKKV